MTAHRKLIGLTLMVFAICPVNQPHALEILYFIEARDFPDVMEEASGLKIADDGTVYVTSEEKATLLKIVDGSIEASSLSPSVFKKSDLGGIDILPDGRFVIANESSSQIGVLDADLQLQHLA